MPITLDGTNGITTPTYGGADTSEYLVPVTAFKNRIINGAMVIDQRNAGASVTIPAADQYTLDRWLASAGVTSKFSVQQSSTAPTGFINSLLVTSLSAYTVGSGEQFRLETRIEGLNCTDLAWGTANAQTVTLSFWTRSSLTGTFGGCLVNSAANRSYPFTYTISAANTWEYKTVTIAGDTTGTWLTTNGIGIGVRFNVGSGSSFLTTAGAWTAGNYIGGTGSQSILATNGATFYITGVQLEVGSTATSFDYRPFTTELQLCQRYAASTFPLGTAWGQNRGAAGCVIVGCTGNTGYGVQVPWRFPVKMRATPSTITTYNPVAANADSRNFALTADRAIGALGFAQNSMDGIVYTATTTASDVGGMAFGVHYSVDAEL